MIVMATPPPSTNPLPSPAAKTWDISDDLAPYIGEKCPDGLYLESAMKMVWDKKPRGYQDKAIKMLLQMHCPPSQRSAMLLVQGTGSGKSTVPQTGGVVTCVANKRLLIIQ